MGIKQHLLLPGVAAWSVAGLLAAGAALPAWSAPVATAVAATSAVDGQRTLDGALQPVRQATLAAQVGGNVVTLAVKAGDRLRAGQLVARVDEREAQAAVQRSEAGLAQAEAEARNARLAAERNRELRAQGFVSQAALDQAETQYKAAQAGVQQAQAGRSQATLQRGFSTINAPFDAVVLATHLEAGDLAAPGRAIATIYAPGALRAVVQVPASMAAAARSATTVQVELADGRRVVPSARSLLPGADPVSQTVEWRLELPATTTDTADAGALLPGQAVRVFFQGAEGASASAKAATAPLVLPAAAVLRRGELTAVYVAQAQRFVLRAVRTGADRGAGVEVLAGLKPGERFAVDAVAAGLAGAVPAK
jgi:RND family efflux transporter MFP subunit